MLSGAEASMPQSKFHGQFINEYTRQLIQDFFTKKGFHQVDTPTLMPAIPLEPGLYPFKTRWHQRSLNFYLATSPESSLKKLISRGIGNCFSIAKAFRDLEDIGPHHNLEFSILEWYEMDKDYHHIKITTEKLVVYLYHGILKKLNKQKTNILNHLSQTIDLTPPWHQFTLQKLFKKFAHIDLSQNLKTTRDDDRNWEPWFSKIMIDKIEPNLPTDKPVFIFDYPTKLSPLCRPCQNSPGFSQRFELFIAGIELANAYTELTDSKVLEANFKKEEKFRQKNSLPSHPYDQQLVKATKNFPDCTGIALGIDRLAMLFANAKSIDQVLYFPVSKLL